MLKRIAIIACLAVIPLSPASAQERPSSLQEIKDTFSDCLQATASVLASARLLELGWNEASATNESGERVDNGFNYFGRSDRAAIVQTGGEEGGYGFCRLNVLLEGQEALAGFMNGWGGRLPAPDEDGVSSINIQGRVLLFEFSGTTEKPRIQLTAATPLESN